MKDDRYTDFTFSAIGTIRSPFDDLENMPIQPPGAKKIKGRVEVFDEFAAGLTDISGFSFITLIYAFHLSKNYSLIIKPFLDDVTHGIFATRYPKRPNQIGMSVVRLKKVEGNVLHIEGVDVVDGTPLLDIKPYVPKFDSRRTKRIGWFIKNVNRVASIRSDGRLK